MLAGESADYTIDAHGLGHSLVEMHIPELDMRVRQLILASPVDGKVIQLRLGTAYQPATHIPTVHPAITNDKRSSHATSRIKTQ